MEPKPFRVVKLHVAFDGHHTASTYAVPDDGRDLMDMTLAELRACPVATADAMLDEMVAARRAPAPSGGKR